MKAPWAWGAPPASLLSCPAGLFIHTESQRSTSHRPTSVPWWGGRGPAFVPCVGDGCPMPCPLTGGRSSSPDRDSWESEPARHSCAGRHPPWSTQLLRVGGLWAILWERKPVVHSQVFCSAIWTQTQTLPGPCPSFHVVGGRCPGASQTHGIWVLCVVKLSSGQVAERRQPLVAACADGNVLQACRGPWMPFTQRIQRQVWGVPALSRRRMSPEAADPPHRA